MRILNIHERRLSASRAEVGGLIDSLASDNDALWPRSTWPPMRFDRPLEVGAVGGHRPIRYSVEEYIPGERIKFKFLGPRGFNGHHRFEVLPEDEGTTVLRHTIDMSTSDAALISWPLVIRPLHDALLEDALALAQASLGLSSTVRPWSAWVRILRWLISRGRARPQETPDPSVERTSSMNAKL